MFVFSQYPRLLACALCVLAGLWASPPLCAQEAEIKAMQAALAAAQTDTAQCRLLEELTYLLPLEAQKPYLQRWKHIAYKGYLQAKSAQERLDLLTSYASARSAEGYMYMYTDSIDLAFAPFEQCLQIDQWLGNQESIATSYNNLGYYYAAKGLLQQALAHFEQALSIELHHQDTSGLLYTLGNIADLHEDQGNYDLALQNYAECLHISQLVGDSLNMGRMYNAIGHAYIRLERYDAAYVYCQRALACLQGQDALNFEVAARGYLAFIELQRKNYARAAQGFEDCLAQEEELGFENGIATTLIDRQGLWDALQKPQEAERDALRALEIGHRLGIPDVVMWASKQLAKIYARKQDYKQALAMQQQYTTLHDSLQNRSIEKSLLRAQLQYEYTQKAVADSIQSIQKQAIVDLQFAQQRSQKRWLLLLVGLVALFAAFIWNRYSLTRRQKRHIEAANFDLSRQHLLNQKIFSVISHDFRGPILSLNLMLDALRDRPLDPSLQQFVREVNAEVRNANEVLNSLLNWAKTEINIHDFQENTASLQAIAHEIMAELGPKIRDKEIVIHHQYAAQTIVALPPDILRIVLRNLLSNAVKFSHHGQAVEIAYEPAQQRLSVRDHGIGIAAAKQTRLFGQAVDTDLGTAQEEGYGMGLYIVSELLHKYDHQIAVESSAAVGTIFSIRPNAVD